MDKKDLDELDRLEYEREQEQFEKYGMDLRKVNRKTVSNKNHKIVKFLKRIGYLSRNSTIVIITLFILALLLYMCVLWGNLYERSNVNVQKLMESQYSIKIKLLDKETSGRTENGKYYFQTKDSPYIKFTAKKHFGEASSDYLDQIVKYYFELWNNPNKKYFIVHENIEDDLLNYELCLDFKQCKDIDETAEIFVEFIKFCKDDYKPYWDVFIKLDDGASDRIYPYINTGTTHEEAVQNIKNLYDMHIKFMKNTLGQGINQTTN